MDRQELLKTLQALHADLSTTERVDPQAERLLRKVTADIERLLDEEQPSPEEDDSSSLSGKLQEMVLEWEAEHPRIARVIGQVADALANLGI